ncbi:MAG: hypothetical protein FWG00_02875, partial [Coriobacteriia bacterium]|nr:hypothetical protein [Coriobacteriia bacterium]
MLFTLRRRAHRYRCYSSRSNRHLVGATHAAAPSLPSSCGLDPQSYAKLTKNYIIAGTPAPTVSLVGAPAGLSITPAGALTIPAGLKAGNYSFTIKAQNASGTVNKAVAVKVNQKLVKPTITGGKS